MREPEILVFAREKLTALEDEKRWSGEASDFRTGSRLLGGTIEIDLADPDRITVSGKAARTRPAGRGDGRLVRVCRCADHSR
jgi:hypothetical protein